MTLTTLHKAKREGWLNEIAGAYAQCPFLSGRWYEQPDELPSLKECDGYFLTREIMGLAGAVYDPTGDNSQAATCYAGKATDEELSGLPPHVISVNEIDPLRDEGLLYYRRLVRAGVPAVGRIVVGTGHGCDLLLGGYMPEVFAATIRDVSGFAKSLANLPTDLREPYLRERSGAPCPASDLGSPCPASDRVCTPRRSDSAYKSGRSRLAELVPEPLAFGADGRVVRLLEVAAPAPERGDDGSRHLWLEHRLW